MATIGASAQYLNDQKSVFTQNKWYVGASLSGLDLSWHKASDWTFGLQAKAGYLFIDDWMVTGALGYEAQTDIPSILKLGVGLRYYVESCGIYGGISGNYYHCDDFNDFRPELSVGYAYFLTGKLTLEPEVYYEISTKDSDFSGFGVRLGFGLYF